MPLTIAEYTGMAWLRSGSNQPAVPQEPAVVINTFSSAGSSGSAMSTIQWSSNTRWVVLSSTGTFFALFGTSALSTVANPSISSTSAQIFSPGQYTRGVSPFGKLIGWST